ncbi:MAG: hypothetical protein KGM24_14335 [Elusimicrobia bacterium]|nr:hypothetical protein [Elusimicrobiota bacterium]
MAIRRTLLLALAALVLAAASPRPARAFLWWRDRVTSAWTAAPVPVDADDSRWDDSLAYENEGLSLQARNDGKTLWLLLTARTEAGRSQLTGAARQDLTIWFMTARGKRPAWGVRLPLRRDGPGASPEKVLPRGRFAPEVAPLPEGFTSRRGAVGQRPIWEFCVPLSAVPIEKDGRVALDFAVTGRADVVFSRRPLPEGARGARGGRGERGEGGEAGEVGRGGVQTPPSRMNAAEAEDYQADLPEPERFRLSVRLGEPPPGR